MAKRKSVKKNSVAKAGELTANVAIIVAASLMEILIDLANSLGDIAFDRKAVYKSVYSRYPRVDDSNIAHQIYELKSRGYIEYKNNDNQSIILTNKTKLKMLEYQSNTIIRDEKYRYLSFDIPKEKDRSRNQFRRAIKRMGFVKIQQSLWVTDKDLSQLVELAAYEYKVENYIAYIIAERSDIDGVVKKLLEKHK